MLPLQVLYSSVLPLQLLYSSDHSALLVVYCTFLSPTFVRLLQSHLLQSCPWPHRSRDHPHRWCPLTSPNRDLPGYIAQWFWLVYMLLILFFLDHSVCFIHLDRLSFCYIYVPYNLLVSYNQFIWVRWHFSVFHFPHSTGGQKGCGPGYGAGGPQERGPTSLSTHPTFTQTTQTGRSPTSGRTSEYVLGMHFFVSLLVHCPHVFSIHCSL